MKIKMFKQTPIANAPDELCYAINKWTEHEAFMSTDEDEPADIVHFNNAYYRTDMPAVIQFHSEPRWKGLMLDCPYKKLVIAQYHATLPEYADCTVVRNVINFDKPEYAYKPVSELKVAYSPSSRVKVGEWHDKGYEETVAALEQSGVDYDVITDVPFDECLRRKAECSVHIDECVTGSYHRCTLEGLAMGKVVIGHLSDEVFDVATNACDSPYFPIIDTDIEGLADELSRLSEYELFTMGNHNRIWMLTFWHPKDIANEYIKIYEEVLGA